MRLARKSEFPAIMGVFKQHREWFPHVRNDYIMRMIENDNCIFSKGVVITFQQYTRKVKLGECLAKKGDLILHQIAVSVQGDGSAEEILAGFLRNIKNDLWLTVRSRNKRARAFYKKMGLKIAGKIDWKSGEIKGTVYVKKYQRRKWRRKPGTNILIRNYRLGTFSL